MVRMSLPSQNYNFIKVRSPCEFKVCQRTNIFNAYIWMYAIVKECCVWAERWRYYQLVACQCQYFVSFSFDLHFSWISCLCFCANIFVSRHVYIDAFIVWDSYSLALFLLIIHNYTQFLWVCQKFCEPRYMNILLMPLSGRAEQTHQ